MDVDYLKCPLDAHDPTSKIEQVLCPVLNRLRYNLGTTHATTGTSYIIPSKSAECCAGKKQPLWDYLSNSLLANPDSYGAMFGGSVYPLSIDPALFADFATGLDFERGDCGKIMDELLLWHAMEASACKLGIPNFYFKDPLLSNEIDFALYDLCGDAKQSGRPDEGWSSIPPRRRLCVFETTIGHRSEDAGKINSSPGSDHAKNKLINYLALKGLRFRTLHFHYLAIAPSGKGLGAATESALKGTDGFNYWTLDTVDQSASERLLNHLDSPVGLAQFRAWHEATIEMVRKAAAEWAENAPT
jgi:hypothetical protein